MRATGRCYCHDSANWLWVEQGILREHVAHKRIVYWWWLGNIPAFEEQTFMYTDIESVGSGIKLIEC